MAFHADFPCHHLTPCSYGLDCLRGLFAQPTPCVFSAVVDMGLYGSGAQDLLLCIQDECLCAILQPSTFKPSVEFPEISHYSYVPVIRYCSLVCYKKHKDQWTVDDFLHEDDIIDKVPVDRLQLLGQSKELRDLLLNPHLRQLLRSIDNGESKDQAMKAAMQEPLFVEFSDCCLKIVKEDNFDV
ncbi:hypothetical protein WMY93_007989 [Mugilogobius chulae]|uniref:Zinc finger HIT domain-containing protein n=1 Tax=Mugilogobius chulae TaxID=88201 RepID=A0AAW0PTC4_9GOBI